MKDFKNSTAKTFFVQYLKSQFFSPWYYIFSFVFLAVVSALFFFKGQFFSGSGSTALVNFWANVPYACILFIPLICSKKNCSDFDFFVPLKPLNVLALKIAADWVSFVASTFTLLIVPICVSFFGDVSMGEVLLPFFFMWIYGFLCVNLCYLIQSLVDNASVTFVISAIVMAIFNSAHLISAYTGLNSVFITLLKSISFAWRFDAASKGIFDSRDFLFILLCSVFVSFVTYVVLEVKKGKRIASFKNLILPFVVLVLLFANSVRYFKRVDFSEGQNYSISKTSKELISSLEGELNISYYRSGTLSDFYPQIRDVKDFLEEFQLDSKKVHFRLYDPDKKEEYQNTLLEHGIIPQSFRSSTTNGETYVSVYSAVILEYEGKEAVIPFILSSETLEYEIDSKLKGLVYGSFPVLHVVMGNGYSLDSDYGFIKPWLSNQNIEIDEIVLDSNFPIVLSMCEGPVLVIGGQLLSESEVMALERYMEDNRGNVILCYSPVMADFTGDWSLYYSQNYYLEDFLSRYGILFEDEIISDLSCIRIVMYSDDNGSSTQSMNYQQWITLPPQTNAKSGLNLFWAMPLSLKDNARPYLVTTDYAWSEKLDFEGEKLLETNPFYVTDLGSGKERGQKITGASSANGRLLVISDQLFLNTIMNGYAAGENGDYRNFEFLVYETLKSNEMSELAELQSKTTRNTTLYKINETETFIRMKNITLILVYGLIPLLLAALCTALNLIKRRK